MTQTSQLFLRVNNPQQLEHGSLPDFRPNQRGATIGSQGADWQLHDSAGSVSASHAAIRWIDGRYVLVDLCGQTYINAHRDPLGHLKLVALCDGDLLTIGKYKISVHLDTPLDTQAYGVDHLREINLSHLFGLNSAEALLHDDPMLQPVETASPKADLNLSEFTGQNKTFTNPDPLYHLNPINPEPKQPIGLKTIPLRLSTDYVADYTGTTRESVTHTPQQIGNALMPQEPIQPPAITNMETETHLASTPLFNALGVSLEGMDTAQVHQRIQEAGNTLRTTIQALLQLYQADRENSLQLSLLGRSYQAIEDNPLRMNLSYEDTVQTLFSSQRSRVHLTPARAIEESMQNINKSQQALVTAIQESLQQVLRALSPDHLATRFADYQNNDPNQTTDENNWQMYRDYFAELTSHRQSGLEKMFWEVFNQTYDRQMRTTDEPQQ
jgi:type VI secretion system protein ImpI